MREYYLIQRLGGCAKIPEIPDSQVEDSKQFECSDDAEERGKEESHPTDSLAGENYLVNFFFSTFLTCRQCPAHAWGC